MSLASFIAVLAASTLFEQSAARLLEARFNRTGLSYRLVDAGSGEVVAQHWEEAERSIPVGSLVKPFLAFSVPGMVRFRCDGRRCWDVRGHGDLDLKHAIAFSCNAYFLRLAAQYRGEPLAIVPPDDVQPETLIGLGQHWRVSAAELAEAYRALLGRADAAEIREGMRLAAQVGTGKLMRADALIKTGTAPCSHRARAPGDGFALVAYPAGSPRYILLVRVHGTTGSHAARTAGEMLHAIQRGR